jgi:glycosyltransferase involved in cell wall biosynthesis
MRLVTVIIPAYNRANWLPALFERLAALSEWIAEVVIVDDGSTDETEDLVKQYPNIRYFRQTNQGPSAARNLGLQQATGEFIHFLDSDDLPDLHLYPALLPSFADSNVQLAVANFRTSTEDGQVLAANYFASRGWFHLSQGKSFDLSGVAFQALLLRHSVIPTSGVVFRRSFLTTLWNPRVRVGEDRLFLLQNLTATTGLVRIHPEPLWNYQVHDANAFHANPRPDRLAYRDNLSLRQIALSVPDLNHTNLKHLAESRARNYFDWAWFCRKQGKHDKAEVLLKASWRLAPSWKILRARIINWLGLN